MLNGVTVLAETTMTESKAASELIKALQAGGHIIYMRHGPTEHTQHDSERETFDDCTQQRNLSEAGRTLLAKIHDSMSMKQIPIGEVYSSPYCRAIDTADIVFGKHTVEPMLKFSISKDKFESEQLANWLAVTMRGVKSQKDNIVFVGHTSNLKDGVGVWPKPEGVMVIFKNDAGQLNYEGMIQPEHWFE
jgi:phosphohistidine phosphatase SixA